MSFDVILPFLRPIAHLIQDPDVTEIMVNGSAASSSSALVCFRRSRRGLDDNLKVAVKNIARRSATTSRRRSRSSTRACRTVARGGRLSAVQRRRHDAHDSQGSRASSRQRNWWDRHDDDSRRTTPASRDENILISGGTSTGKTTLLNALAAFLPADDRIVLIEDTAELQIERPNLVRFEARRASPACRPSTIRDLLGRRSAIVRIASSSVKCAAGKRSTCSRPSTPVTRARCRPFTRIRRRRRCRVSRHASCRAASNCRIALSRPTSATRSTSSSSSNAAQEDDTFLQILEVRAFNCRERPIQIQSGPRREI